MIEDGKLELKQQGGDTYAMRFEAGEENNINILDANGGEVAQLRDLSNQPTNAADQGQNQGNNQPPQQG